MALVTTSITPILSPVGSTEYAVILQNKTKQNYYYYSITKIELKMTVFMIYLYIIKWLVSKTNQQDKYLLKTISSDCLNITMEEKKKLGTARHILKI